MTIIIYERLSMLSINHDKANHDDGGREINESELKQMKIRKVYIYQKENLEKW